MDNLKNYCKINDNQCRCDDVEDISIMDDNGNDIPVIAFVESQPLASVYRPEEAFEMGTLFKNLNKPFLGGGCHE